METVALKIVTTEEMISILGVSPTTFWRLKKNKKIPYIKVGRLYRYNVEKVINALSVDN